MNILLLSAYDAESHRRWRTSLVENCSEFTWSVLTLPPRHFNWRVRGNALSWAFGEESALLKKFYDLIVATSMVDLSALKGMVPSLGYVPSVLYFHENQFAYPLSKHQKHPLEPRLVSLYSALVADRLVFNSAYNLSSFHLGVETLLEMMPDCVPKGLVRDLENKSQVLQVPLEHAAFNHTARQCGTGGSELQVLWNHRWEYDKGPEKLLGCLQALPADLALKFHVVGQRFRSTPDVFTSIQQLLRERDWLGQWGYIDNEGEYRQLLKRCHVVLSTALHDFQGLSVLEAVAAGCVPVVPDRLAYTELFSPEFRYLSVFNNDQTETHGNVASESHACAERIFRYAEMLRTRHNLPAPPDLSALSWKVKQGSYSDLLNSLGRR